MNRTARIGRHGLVTGLAAVVLGGTLVAATLTGCARTEYPRAAPSLPDAALGAWSLTSLTDAEGKVADPASPPQLSLSSANGVSGTDGCRAYTGSLSIAPEDDSRGSDQKSVVRVTVGRLTTPTHAAAVACPGDSAAEFGTRYTTALTAIRTLRIHDATLELDGPHTTLIFSSTDGIDTPTPSPDPTATPGATNLPSAAARRWVSTSQPALAVDLRTGGRISVSAGCLGFTGALAVTGAPDDPAAGAPAGPTVAIAVTPQDDGKVHCLGFTVEQQDFAAAVTGATRLTVVDDRLYLSGGDETLELAAAD